MAKLYRIKNEATDNFYVVATDEDAALTAYATFVSENPEAPQGDGTAAVSAQLVASDIAGDCAPWVTFVE